VAFSAVSSVPPRKLAFWSGLVVTYCSPKEVDGPTTRALPTSASIPSIDS
jgi:hypothetical protein